MVKMFFFWNVALFYFAFGVHEVFGNALFPVEFPVEKTNEIALEKWRTMDKNIRYAVESVIHQILPLAVKSFMEVNVSADCSATLLKMVIGLKQLKEWPLKMLDANGKIVAGIFSGSMGDFGHYDQCLAISNIDEYIQELSLQGQYCVVEFRPPLPPKPSHFRLTDTLPALENLTTDDYVIQFMKKNANKFYYAGLTLGICVPSTCSKTDVENILSFVASKAEMYSNVHTCEIKEPIKVDALQCFLIGVFFMLVLLCIIGTAVDCLPYFRNKLSSKENRGKALSRQLLTSFSIERNVQDLLHIDENDGARHLKCIHGFRFFSMAWIVLTFTYMFHMVTKMKNAAIVPEYITSTPFQVIANGTICMETFFCIGGLVMSYSLLNATRNNRKFYQYVPAIIARRLWRLVPPILFVIKLAIVVPIISSGPLWNDIAIPHAEYCRNDWFYNVLFISNYMPQTTACIPHLWYTSMDFQFYLLAIILLAIYSWKTIYGTGVNIIFIVLSIFVTAGITYWKNFDPIVGAAIINFEEMEQHMKWIVTIPTTHLASYCIGFALGVCLVKYRRNIKLHPAIQVSGWCLSTIFCLTILLTPAKWNRGVPFNTAEQILFAGLHRPVWTLGVCWVIFTCATGNGGVVSRVLSWRGLVPLSRLTLQVYLLCPAVILFYIGTQRDMTYANNFTGVWEFFGHLVITYLLAFLSHLLYAGPFIQMGKLIFAHLMKGYHTEECQPTTEVTVCSQSEKHEEKM